LTKQKSAILNETLTLITTIYQDSRRLQFYEKFIEIDVIFINSGIPTKIANVKLDLSYLLNNCMEEINDTYVLPKKCNFQGKLMYSLKITFVELVNDNEETDQTTIIK